MDLLRYQIEEIDSAQLCPGEEEELSNQRKRIRNHARIMENLSLAYQCLAGEEESPGAMETLSGATDALESIGSFSQELSQLSEQASELYYNLEDLTQALREQLEDSDYDPSQLEEIEARLDVLYRLKKKYGPTEEEILSFRDQAAEQLEQLESSDERRSQLERSVAALEKELEDRADKLSQERRQAAKRFAGAGNRKPEVFRYAQCSFPVGASHRGAWAQREGQSGFSYLHQSGRGAQIHRQNRVRRRAEPDYACHKECTGRQG